MDDSIPITSAKPRKPIWGAKAIGVKIERSTRSTFHLLETGAILGRKVGNLWVSEEGELTRTLFGEDA